MWAEKWTIMQEASGSEISLLNFTGLPGIHYLCGACESSTIPDKEAGMEKRKSTAQNETVDDSQQTQRTEDEEPE